MTESKPRAALSPTENLIVGLAGGTIETLAFMPILTWKLCLQEGRSYPKFPGMVSFSLHLVSSQCGNLIVFPFPS
jgi:hypothetical protein